MPSTVLRIVGTLLRVTRAELWPVHVRRGIASGARWTLYPCSAYWRGTHEPGVQQTLLELGGGNILGWTCWDVGAHFGLYAVGLARRVGPTGQVAAFEPDPVSFSRLARHARMNDLPGLKIYHAAVSNHSAGAEIYTYGQAGSTTTHLPYPGEPRSERAQPIKIDTLNLDALVATGELRLPQFIKLDVEGHGAAALQGMADSVARSRPVLLVALHSDQEIAGICRILDPLQYERAEIVTGASELEVGHDYLFRPKQRA